MCIRDRSLIWGGSFLFIAIAVKELPALLIVLARVGIAAAILIPVHLLVLGKLPTDLKTWIACGGMSVMNNVIPFTAISWGQHHITGGLASVINATTPMFAAIFMAMAGLEGITARKALRAVMPSSPAIAMKMAANIGVVALMTEASPPVMWCCPQEIAVKGMTLFMTDMPPQAIHVFRSVGSLPSTSRCTGMRIAAAMPTRASTMSNAGSSFTAMAMNRNEPPQISDLSLIHI